jgi:hypothetical protein
MNTFFDIVFIFLFTLTIFFFDIPNLNNNKNYFNQKLIIFLAIFVFNLTMDLIKKSRNNCKIVTKTLITDSLLYGLLAILAYSLFIDLKTDFKSEFMESMTKSSFSLNITVVFLITLVYSLTRVIRKSLNENFDKCIVE